MKEKELERLTNLKKVEEELYNEKGLKAIAGIDEAGRGPLAGPVVVACALMPKTSMIEGVNDSKKISEKKREQLYEQITSEAISYGIGIIDQKEIDEINILQATKKGLTTAIKDMEAKLAKKPELEITKPDAILVDALTKIDTDGILPSPTLLWRISATLMSSRIAKRRLNDSVYPLFSTNFWASSICFLVIGATAFM